MRKVFLVFTLSWLGVSSIACSKKDTDWNNVFVDGLNEISGFSLFNLLDDYPALRNAMLKLNPSEFNERLNFSLIARKSNVSGSLRSLRSILANQDSGIREALVKLHSLIEIIRTGDSRAYKNSIVLMDRIRRSPGNLVPSLIPIRNSGLDWLYRTKSQEALDQSIDDLVATLKDSDNQSTFREVEDFLYKLLGENQRFKQGLAVLLEGLAAGENPRVGDFRDRLGDVVGGLGNSFGKFAGLGNGNKTAGRVIKEMLANTRDYSMVGGAFYVDSIYNTPGQSARFEIFLQDLYVSIRRLIFTPANLLRDPSKSILSSLAENYNQLQFTGRLSGLDRSLGLMGELDLRGRRRASSSQAFSVSSLEHLFFTLSLVDKFGFNWQNDPGRPQIISENGGRITIGDALHSLSSKMDTTGTYVRLGNSTNGSNVLNILASEPMTDLVAGLQVLGPGIPPNTLITSVNAGARTVTMSNPSTQTRAEASGVSFTFREASGENANIANLGVSAILWTSSISDDIKRNGSTFNFNLNTSALALLEGESRGPIGGASDPVFSKTVPWALGLLATTLYSGKAPYFNKNRTDSSGNILTLDGRVYRNSNGQDQIYRRQWNTARYSIPALNPNNPGNSRWVGLGGFTGLDSSYNGSSYTITEIEIPESERAVSSDEEAFYKNFQWLLYQKRMVLVIPVAIDALGGTLREAAYATIIGNGLSGLMNVKPYCTVNACAESDIGRWLKSGQFIKGNFKTPERDLQTFSNTPGDSVMLLEVYGFGIGSTASTQFGFTDDTVLNQVYNLLFSKASTPSEFYGPIPPVIRWNFEALERLGFLTNQMVTPGQTQSEWSVRNRLLPLIAAIAKTLYDQTDNSAGNPKDPFLILSSLADVLARPYLFRGNDPTAALDTQDSATTNANVETWQFRIEGYAGPGSTFGIRSPSMPEAFLYYPSAGIRSPFSILLEKTRRANDGLLNLISKGNGLEGLGRFLFELGKKENESPRKKFNQGLQLILNEIRLSGEITESNHFNITESLEELKDFIIEERDSSGGRLTDTNLTQRNTYDKAAEFIYDFLSSESPYGYAENLKGIFRSLAFAKPTFGELNSFLDVVASIFVDKNGNKTYFITSLITEDLVKILINAKGNTRSLVGLLEGMTRDNGFLPFFWSRATSDYNADQLLQDLQRFLVSPEVQTRDQGPNDLFFNAGEILGLFSDLAEKPRMPGGMPHWFPDHWNKAEDSSTAFDRLNFLLSKK
jgi:hypothetical protein